MKKSVTKLHACACRRLRLLRGSQCARPSYEPGSGPEAVSPRQITIQTGAKERGKFDFLANRPCTIHCTGLLRIVDEWSDTLRERPCGRSANGYGRVTRHSPGSAGRTADQMYVKVDFSRGRVQGTRPKWCPISRRSFATSLTRAQRRDGHHLVSVLKPFFER